MKKSRIIYLILFVISLIFTYNYPGIISATFLYLLICLPIISLLYTFIVYVSFKITQEIDSRQIIKGEKVHYTCSVHNETILPYSKIDIRLSGENLLFQNQIETHSFILLPKSKYALNLNLTCKYRGVYNVGIDHIEITDFFNLFKVRFYGVDNKMVIVYPRILNFKNLFIQRKGQLENSQKRSNRQNTDMDLSEIRKYEYGDRLSHIHWKISAKYDEWMSKKLENVTDEKFLFLIDLKKNNLGYERNIILEDKFIEILVALTNQILIQNISIEMIYDEYELSKTQYDNYSQFERFYNFSTKVTFQSDKPFHKILDGVFESRVNWSGEKEKIFLFTTNITTQLIQTINSIKFKQYSIILIYISMKDLLKKEDYEKFILEENNIIESNVFKGIQVYQFDINDSIKNKMEGEVI